MLEFDGHGVGIMRISGGNRGPGFPAFSRIGDEFVCKKGLFPGEDLGNQENILRSGSGFSTEYGERNGRARFVRHQVQPRLRLRPKAFYINETEAMRFSHGAY